MIDVDYDKKILELKRNIEELERKKQEAELREEGFRAFDEAFQSVFEKYGLTEYDLFLLKSVSIYQWLEKLAAEDEQPGCFHDIKELMGRLYARDNNLSSSRKKVKKVRVNRKASTPRLEIGIYVNPFTKVRIEKKRRNPKELDNWLQEYSYEEVASWRQDD